GACRWRSAAGGRELRRCQEAGRDHRGRPLRSRGAAGTGHRAAAPQMRWTLAILGAAAVFSASWIVHLFTGVPEVAIDGPLAVAALVFLWKQSGEKKPPAAGRGIFFAACAVAAAALIDHIARYPDGGNDAFIIWNLRARWLFRAGADFRSAFSPEILFWTHQDYPLLLPGLVARGFALLGHESRAVPAVAAVLFTA